jgi:5'-AMP-activated protein kinase regulatory beta subunit
MGNQQPLNGGSPGGPQPGAGDDPRQQRGAMPPGAYGGYMSSGSGVGGVGGVGGGVGGGGVANYTENQQQQQERIERSGSDASMTLLDADKTAAAIAANDGDNVAALENWFDDDTVPTVFRWEHGGRQVYITGTFNGWSRQIPMHRSGNDFTYIHNLKRGKHAFKFIVDDEWRFAPDQPTVADIEGRINNFIDVTDFKAYTGDKEFEKEKAAAEYGYIGDEEEADPADKSGENSDGSDAMANRPDKDGEVFSHTMPDLDDYTKEPPPLPPHLRHIILNKPPQLQDTAALPVPQHVALNHLYCTAIKDNMMVLGITQRYKTKFVTTVYYSPCASK